MSVIGLSLPEAFSVLAPNAEQSVRAQLAGRYKEAFTEHRKAGVTNDSLYPGMKDVVQKLVEQEKIALAIATGKSRAGVDRLLQREGWQDVFVSVQTADHHPSKPNPSMIFQALQDSGVDADDAVMVGDTTFDIEMAMNAGIAAVGVDWGYHPVWSLQRAGAHRICTAVESLHDDMTEALICRRQTRD